MSTLSCVFENKSDEEGMLMSEDLVKATMQQNKADLKKNNRSHDTRKRSVSVKPVKLSPPRLLPFESTTTHILRDRESVWFILH